MSIHIKVNSSDISRYLAELRHGGFKAYDKKNVTVRIKLDNGQIVDANCPLETLGHICERALEKKKANVYMYIKLNRVEGRHVGKKEVRIVIDTAHIRDGMKDGLKGMAEAAGRSFERALDKNVNVNINIDSKHFADVCDKVCDKAVDTFAKVCYRAIHCALIAVVLWKCIGAIVEVLTFQVQADYDRSTYLGYMY